MGIRNAFVMAGSKDFRVKQWGMIMIKIRVNNKQVGKIYMHWA